MKCRTIQFAHESVPLSWFVCGGIQVITWLSSKQNYKNNSCTQFERKDVGLWPFYNPYVKKRELLTGKFSQMIVRNHFGFITASAIKLCFM